MTSITIELSDETARRLINGKGGDIVSWDFWMHCLLNGWDEVVTRSRERCPDCWKER